jgi:hypothetical protein
LTENEKDWGNPVFLKIYASLAQCGLQDGDERVLDWLNANGFCNLTCCPECHVDDFTHVEGCLIGYALDEIGKMLRTQRRKLDPQIRRLAEDVRSRGGLRP